MWRTTVEHDVWVEVDLGALKHNLAQVRGAVTPPSPPLAKGGMGGVAPSTRLMAVIKGNGYGHGYIEPAQAFVEAGADALAVTRLDEALPLRQSGISAPILLFAPIQPANAEPAIEAGLDLTICSVPLARAISEAAVRIGRTARVWVKVDTGMGRLGVLPGEALALFEAITKLPGIQIAGTYTHFARANEADLTPTRAQFRLFEGVLASLKTAGIDYGLASAANSSAILRLPASHFDMVRPGTALYGQYPSSHVPHSLDLQPTWKLKARVCEVRDLPRGSAIGYGGEYVTTRPTRTAIVPVGFADGFTLIPEGAVYRQSVFAFLARKMRRRPWMEINGVRAPVLGRVAMQMTVLDVTGIEGVSVGSEVTIPALRIPTSPLIARVYVA